MSISFHFPHHIKTRNPAGTVFFIFMIFLQLLFLTKNAVPKDISAPDIEESQRLFNKGYKSNSDQAILLYKESIRLNPDNIYSLYNLGHTYLEKGMYDDAIKMFSRVIEIKPDAWDAYNNRSVAYSALKRFDEEEKDLSSLISGNPDYSSAYYNRGYLFFKQKQYEKAAQDYSSYISLKPFDYMGYYIRGASYLSLNKPDEALEDFSQVKSLYPNNPKIYALRAEIFRATGRTVEAAKEDAEAAVIADKLKKRKIGKGSPRERLSYAIRFGLSGDAKESIADGVDLTQLFEGADALDSGYSFLSEAASFGRTDLVEYILSKRCPVNIRDADGTTPLMKACMWGHYETIKTLIQHGADPGLKNEKGDSAIHYAAMEWEPAPHAKILALLVEKGALINDTDNDGYTPLMFAAESVKQRLEIAEYLIRSGADVSLMNNASQSAVHIASKAGNASILKIILMHNSGVNTQDSEGSTPLIYASNKGDAETVKLLLRAKADNAVFDNQGYSALMYAAENNDASTVKILLENGADPELANNEGLNPIVIAHGKSFTSLEKMLKQKKKVHSSSVPSR